MNLQPVDLIHVGIYLGTERVPIGRLAMSRGQIYFEYDPEFIERGIEISPFKLPLAAGAVPCDDKTFEGLFGVFNDSLPDGWGRLLLDRAVQARGVAYQRLTPLDRLAHIGDHGMGALTYDPDYSDLDKDRSTVDLGAIEKEVNKVLEGEPSDILRELLELGGSSAGARPKILVGYNHHDHRVIHGAAQLPNDFDAWMIKFPSSLDQKDIANIEYAYSLMAKDAGMEMPETRLFQEPGGKSYFGVKRFDRQGNKRIHMHTVAGLLHADHRIPSLDYENLLRCVMALTKDITEVEKAFRLAVFNVFSHNRDDHSKNFSFLMNEKGEWRFAPVYDLTFSYGPGREHSSMVMGEGRNPGSKDLLKLGDKFQIKKAKMIIEEVQFPISNWKDYAQEAGVSNQSMTIIGKELEKIK
ncbi:MAG: type II toxin-antitoxin system HipA family toxin [Marinoscillum sp.]